MVARVPRVVARVPMMVAIWLLGCCYAVVSVPRMVAWAVARVHSLVAKVLLCGC